MQMKNIFIAVVLVLLFCSLHVGAQDFVGVSPQVSPLKKLPPREIKNVESLHKRPEPKMTLSVTPVRSAKKEKSQCGNAVPRHIGFDALGSNMELGLHKNEKKLEAVTLNFSSADSVYTDGIPLPCMQMIEVTVNKNDKNKKQSDVFDLKVAACSRNPNNEFSKITKAVGNIFKSDPNAKDNLKKFSFNPKEKNNYLQHKYLQSLYADGTNLLEDAQGVGEVNRVLKIAGCRLKRAKAKGRSIEDYVECDDKSERKDIENHLSKSLVDECAVSYASDAVGELSFYSSSPERTKEENVESFKECVQKHNNVSESLKLKSYPFKLDPMPKIKAQGDEFVTYDFNCNIKNVDEVVNNLLVSDGLFEISKQYSVNDDFFICHDCQGVKILPDSKVEFVREIGESINSACYADVDEFISQVENKCNDVKSLSCNKVADLKCAKGLKIEEGLLKTSNYDEFVASFRKEIISKYILPLHQATAMMVGENSQNRVLSEGAAVEFKERIKHLRKCVEDPKKIEFLKVANPQPAGSYLASQLKYLSSLLKTFAPIKEESTPEDIKRIINSGDKSPYKAFKQYASDTTKLSKLSEEEMRKDASKDNCSMLSNIANNALACELSPEALKSAGKTIDSFSEKFSQDNKNKLDIVKEQQRDKEDYPSSDVSLMSEYLTILEEGFSSKSLDKMARLLAIHEDIGENKTKDLELDCGEYTALMQESDLRLAFGKDGAKLKSVALVDAAVAAGEEGEEAANKKIADLEDQLAQLQAQNQQLQQQLNMALAQMQGGGMAGSGAYANAMLGGFSEFANSLSAMSANTTNALIGSFGTYAQSFDKMSADFSQQMYNSHNSSMNGMLYSQQMYMQSMQMSQPQHYSPNGAYSGWI